MAPTDNQYLREEYRARINRVLDYIEAHIDEELNLETLARVASFSPFHFHRIFRALQGEPLFQFIQRIRLERAASQLALQPKKPVTRIALDCGFSGSASFARAFRDQFGMSATAWRRDGHGRRKPGIMNSKTGKAQSKTGKDRRASSGYHQDTTIKRRSSMNKTIDLNISIKQLPEVNVAYVRHVGPFKGDSALFGGLIGRLCTWAGPRGLLGPDLRIMALYHDNPDITEEQKLRLSVCLPVAKGTKVDGEVGLMTIAAGTYAVAHLELAGDEYDAAWQSLYKDWLPGSGYQPDDLPPYEIYYNDPKTHPQGKHIVDICLPVKPL